MLTKDKAELELRNVFNTNKTTLRVRNDDERDKLTQLVMITDENPNNALWLAVDEYLDKHEKEVEDAEEQTDEYELERRREIEEKRKKAVSDSFLKGGEGN